MSRRRLAVDASSATVGLSRACADSRDGSRGGSTSAPAGGAVARPIVDGIDARAPAGPRARFYGRTRASETKKLERVINGRLAELMKPDCLLLR